VCAVVPVHSVQPLSFSVVDPVADGRLTHVESKGDLVLRPAPSNGGYDRLATDGLPVTLLLMATSKRDAVFSVHITAN
jgi:hypothetical protein